MYDFESQIDVSYYALPEGVEFTTQKIIIKWNLDIDIRNWGINDISIGVPDQPIVLIFEKWNEETDSWEEFEKEIELQNIEVDLDNEFELGNIAVCPVELDIMKDKAILRF